MRKPRRLSLSVLLAVAGLLAFAGVASAEVTTSKITSPSGNHFSIFDRDNQTSLTVSGESDGEEGDRVEIRCFYEGETESSFVEDSVEVDENGDFSTEVNPERISESVCNLRAIPQDATPDPEELRTSFTGPLTATSYSETDGIETGPNAGLNTDFYAWGQGLTAADDYSSMGDCGIEDQFLYDSSQTQTTATFFCNDYFYVSPAGSEIQVDGENAYTPTMLADFNDGAPGLPEVEYGYDYDPASGNLTIHEVDPLLECNGAPVPPSEANCPAPESAGVSDHRTIVEDHDGHLTTISDEFLSTDGEAHSLDLEPENEQYFAPTHAPGVHGEEVAYRFPGEAGYSTHEEGDEVSFDATVPSVTYAMREGAADGDAETGRGAIILDSPASPATFNNVDSERSGFSYKQSATVPAGGSTTLRAAYASAYTEADLAKLVADAEAALRPVPVNPIVPPANPVAPAKPTPPSGKFQVGKLKLNKAKGTAILTVNLPGAGTLKLSGKQVKPAKAVAKAAGKAKLKVTPKPSLAKKLAGGGSAKVSVKLSFAPVGGAATHQTRKLRLVHN